MISGIASMTYSRPLRGSTRPKVEMIARSSTPSWRFRRCRPRGSIAGLRCSITTGRAAHAVDLAQKTRGGRAHHDNLLTVFRDETHRFEGPWLGLRRDRVERRDDRLRAALEEHAKVVVVCAVVPHAIEAELVLDVDDVDVRRADRDGRVAVSARLLLADAPADFGSVGARSAGFVDGRGKDADGRISRLDRCREIGCERGDA